jgi:hypothetical protein
MIQSLPLRAGLLDPSVASAGRIGGILQLGGNTFQADVEACGEHLEAVDF